MCFFFTINWVLIAVETNSKLKMMDKVWIFLSWWKYSWIGYLKRRNEIERATFFFGTGSSRSVSCVAHRSPIPNKQSSHRQKSLETLEDMELALFVLDSTLFPSMPNIRGSSAEPSSSNEWRSILATSNDSIRDRGPRGARPGDGPGVSTVSQAIALFQFQLRKIRAIKPSPNTPFAFTSQAGEFHSPDRRFQLDYPGRYALTVPKSKELIWQSNFVLEQSRKETPLS